MHKATCAGCGKICEVPFRPTGSKPVFCRDCFQNNGGSDVRRSEGRNFDRSNGDEREMHDAVCSQCGNECQIPFQPRPGRDVFCSRCFEKNRASDTGTSDRRTFDKPSYNREDRQPKPVEIPNYKTQFETLNAKMDKILDLLTTTEVEPVEPTTTAIVANATEEEKGEEPKTKKASPKKATKTKKTTSAKKK